MGQALYGAMHKMSDQPIREQLRIPGAKPKLMSMPISNLAIPVVMVIGLAACGGNSAEDLKNAENDADEAAALDGKIECALAGSISFERGCTTEQIAGNEGKILVIRHPDGGFRRFNILTDGRGLAPADGFDETKISLLSDGMIEVSSGDDKYRLPAQIKGKDTPATGTADKVTG
jgi:hypothetical protein